MSKVWFITGTSTGFGRQFVEQLLQTTEDRVIATARKLEAIQDFKSIAPDRVSLISLDVTNKEQIKTAVQEAVDTFGRIDVVVNNAGYGLYGMIEEYSDEQIRKQFDVNVFGVLDVIRATLPIFKNQNSGHYVNLSSFFGTWSMPPFSLYAASKFAVEGFSEAMASELAGFGIRTTIVEPAVFATDFLGHSLEHTDRKPEYDSVYAAYNEGISSLTIGDPVKAVKTIIDMINSENPPLHFPVGSFASHSIRNAFSKRIEEINAWEKLSSEAD
ncbi:SDR family NAD(P)-dependent oxidoreductase [Paenibacillus glycanilyticus]|uniref:SDR family NAD(P)-dependent oxidoreductase n=1 Tax=Paenibacillus glycanilyticus TaxID=126569 RepID=UPI002041214A|nr:SDR family NAD(P)-dependent oxidoreductase [Paenibacillus glycanilyticus]MCM3626150.1 SDR family NAD(P)-dependent oxidoreductase [Paenibacillus glycanilyticus]